MPKQKYKRLTQKEKNERAAVRKKLREDGLLPPKKPRLDRRKFAAEVMEEYKACGWAEMSIYLHQAIACMVDDNMTEVTPEQVGVLKVIKIALETKKFYERLEAEGRDTFKRGELLDVVYPIYNL